mgnify:CR=1 FL=1
MLRSLVLSATLLAVSTSALAEQCPPLLQGELTKLRSQETIDLCQGHNDSLGQLHTFPNSWFYHPTQVENERTHWWI